MPVYAYKATDVDDSTTSGTLVADSPRQARDALRGRGLRVQHMALAAVAADGAWRRAWATSRQRRQRPAVAAAVRELATLLGVGIPLLEALDTLIRQHRGAFRVTLQQLRDRVSAGVGLAEAMGELPGVFDEFCTNIVEVGENSGTLDTALERLAEFKERSAQFKSRLFTALLYPSLVLVMAVVVSLFLMTFVVPKLLAGLLDAGRPIPWITRCVKGASDFLVADWWLLAAGLLVLGGAALLAGRQPRCRLALHRLQLKLPWVGDLVRKEALCRIAVVIGTLLKSGIVFNRAVHIAQRTTRNLVLRQALAACEEAVLAGGDISKAMDRTGAFPATVIQVFAVGEQSGRLEEMLDRLARDYDRQVATATQRLTTVLEPLLILMIVMLVGAIAFATILPILEAGHVL